MIRKVLPNIIANQITGVQPMMSAGMGTGKSVFREYYNRMFGSKLYNRKYWPYQYEFKGSRIEWIAAERWCWDNIRGRYWHSSGTKFVFKRDADAILFSLRWPCEKY